MEFDKIYTKVNKRGGIKSVTYILTTNGCIITVSTDNIHIENSYRITNRKDIKDIIEYIYEFYINKVIENRTQQSCINEWIAHNNLYKLNIMRDHTADVDLDYPQEWYIKIIWYLLSRIVL